MSVAQTHWAIGRRRRTGWQLIAIGPSRSLRPFTPPAYPGASDDRRVGIYSKMGPGQPSRQWDDPVVERREVDWTTRFGHPQ